MAVVQLAEVGKEDTSDIRGVSFESSHRQNFVPNVYIFTIKSFKTSLRLPAVPCKQMFFPKVTTAVFYVKVVYFNIVQTSPNIWSTFVRKFVAKNFKKSPNLDTLQLDYTFNNFKTQKIKILQLGGMLMFTLLNKMNSHWNILLFGLLEVILVSWVYGVKRFIGDIQRMGVKIPNYLWWKLLKLLFIHMLSRCAK